MLGINNFERQIEEEINERIEAACAIEREIGRRSMIILYGILFCLIVWLLMFGVVWIMKIERPDPPAGFHDYYDKRGKLGQKK